MADATRYHPDDPDRPVLSELMLDSISDCVFAVDRQRRIIAMNDPALAALGRSREDVLGRPCHEVLRFDICRQACALRSVQDTGRPISNQPVEIVHGDGRRTPTSLSSAVLRDRAGREIGGVETFRDLSAHLRKLYESGRNPMAELLTVDPAMRELLDLVPTIASAESVILLTGATGTGKNLVARAIHALSARCDGPLVTVNCAALPESLLESELFGYRAGAFTGADRDRVGRIAAAEGGTLFLDEIGDIPLAMQVKLLGFLQTKTYEPLGDVVPRKADVRILAATHQDLQELVKAGRFRQDLYYRINVVNLKLPSLGERPRDIPLLAQRFLDHLSGQRGKVVKALSGDALSALAAYPFPGNVRELENVIEHAYVFCIGETLELEHLPARVRDRRVRRSGAVADLVALESRFLVDVLERHGWSRTRTAEALGIHRTTLQRRIRKLGLKLPRKDGRSRPEE